jgi:hypothetical protein
MRSVKVVSDQCSVISTGNAILGDQGRVSKGKPREFVSPGLYLITGH